MLVDHFSSEDSVFTYKEDSELLSSKSRKSGCKDFKPIILCILIFELCERLTFYSLTANLIPFCEKYMGMSSIVAMNFSMAFTGCIYFLCIFCGWISDCYLGKFRTIWFSGLIYLAGVILVTTVTFDFNSYKLPKYALTKTEEQVFSGIGLFLIAIGTGGIKTNVGPLGAEQFEEKDENLIRLFFIWLYWFINLGSAIGFAIVTYVQQNISFFTGFLVPLCSIFAALVIFLSPQKFYRRKNKTKANQIVILMKVLSQSIKRKSKSIYKYDHLMDYARLSNGGSYEDGTINDILKIKQVIPVLLTFIPFYIAYVQMQSSYFVQGEHMFLNISTFVIPVASLNIVNSAVIIFVIPILAVLIYPLIIKCFSKSPSPLRRIGFGLFLSALSVLIAAILEVERKRDIRENGFINQTIFNKTYEVSRISVLTQIPQFFFVAAGEVFASATGLEFAYSQAPVLQQGIITGLFYVMMGTGSFVSVLLVWLVNLNPNNQWMGDDINSAHYEYFYFLLTGIIFLDVLIFILIARKYKYVDLNEEKLFVVKYQRQSKNDSIMIS